MKVIKRLLLCTACGRCPEVVVYKDGVHIGEEGNLVRLNKQEWNNLVEKIKAGCLDILSE